MRAIHILYALAIVGLAGSATAGPGGSDESDQRLDLQSVAGKTLYLKCERATTEDDCLRFSVWEESNPVPGLQTTVFASHKRYDPDTRLFG